METSEFQGWLPRIDGLTTLQGGKVTERMVNRAKSREFVAIAEEWVTENRPCPRCNRPRAT